MNLSVIIAIGAFSLICSFIVIVFVCSNYNKYLLVTKVNATVINKRVDRWKGPVGSPWATEYYVLFNLENGEQIELIVPNQKNYDILQPNEIGVLSYQKKLIKTIFIEFRQ